MNEVEDRFQQAIINTLGDELKESDELCTELWSALANVDWYHPESGEEASYSFRAAGALIANIIGRGDYMDWYCSGPYAVVSSKIAHSLRKEGWIYDDIGMICDEPGCINQATCGSPTDNGYRHTCGKHAPPLK